MDGNKILSDLQSSGAVPTPRAAPSSPAATGAPNKRIKAKEKAPDDIFYDQAGHCFWSVNGHGEWAELTEGQLKRELRYLGYSKDQFTDRGLTQVEHATRLIQLDKSVHFAGQVAGYFPGVYNVCNQRILVTRGPVIPKPVEGPWPTLERFLTQLLEDEVKYLHAWLKCSLMSLKAGSPFRPGQLLAIAGPAGCGKSLLQELITEILGGRVAQPYDYLSGATDFNGDLFAAEHLAIEDQVASTDMRSRRHLAAKVKMLTANRVQKNHTKGETAFPLAPFWRVTITVNNDHDHLMVMPPLDDSLIDKVIILLAHKVKFPFTGEGLEERKAYRAKLSTDLPHYLFWLRRWRMPESLQDPRWGCVAYQNAELKLALLNLDPEHKFWTMIQALGVVHPGHVGWTGSSIQFEIELRKKDTTGEIGRLLYYNTACGGYLAKLSKAYPDHVKALGKKKGQPQWQITIPDDDYEPLPD